MDTFDWVFDISVLIIMIAGVVVRIIYPRKLTAKRVRRHEVGNLAELLGWRCVGCGWWHNTEYCKKHHHGKCG